MKVRMSGRRKSNAAFATVRRKEYRCPDCGAEIALKDIDVRTDMMFCRSCGKRHSLKRQAQREAAQREPGEPPRGVIVRAGVMTPDGPGEDRVIYPHRNLPLLAFLLCFAGGWTSGALCGIAPIAAGFCGFAMLAYPDANLSWGGRNVTLMGIYASLVLLATLALSFFGGAVREWASVGFFPSVACLALGAFLGRHGSASVGMAVK